MRNSCISVLLAFFILCATGLSGQELSGIFEAFFSDRITDPNILNGVIGKDIPKKEMLELSKKYSEMGFLIRCKHGRFGIGVFSGNSKVIIILEPVNKTNKRPILDIIGLSLSKGEDIWGEQILLQSKYDKKGSVESPDEVGLLVVKTGVPVPTDKRIVPTYIITVGPDSKLQIRKPTDDSRFIFVQGGYI